MTKKWTKTQVIDEARPLKSKAIHMLLKEKNAGTLTEEEFHKLFDRAQIIDRYEPIKGKELSHTVLKKRHYESALWILEYTRDNQP